NNCPAFMLDVSRSDLTAGVAGAGTMGRGIAQVLAQCGIRTLLYDAQPGAAQRGLDSIAQACARLAEKGRIKDPQAITRCVEVVDGVLTERSVTDALTALARRFGHTPIRCQDTPGFVVNHAGRAFVPEALRILAEGIADFATIDRILVDAAGFRLGPFGLMD